MSHKDLELARAYKKRYYQANKVKIKAQTKATGQRARRALFAIIVGAKSVPCHDCKVQYPSYVMDFDHVRGEKIDSVSEMACRGVSATRLMAEIEKCEVVCANCHRERTFSRRKASQNVTGD